MIMVSTDKAVNPTMSWDARNVWQKSMYKVWAVPSVREK